MIKMKKSPFAARAYWERHRTELIRELQDRIDKSNPLATKNPQELTYREALQLANIIRLPDMIREYTYQKIKEWVERLNEKEGRPG